MPSTISASFAGSKPICGQQIGARSRPGATGEPHGDGSGVAAFLLPVRPIRRYLRGSLGCREKRRNGAGQHRVGNLMKVKDIVATIGSLLDRPE